MVVLIADAPPHGESTCPVHGPLHRKFLLMESQVSARTEIVRDDARAVSFFVADDLQRSRPETLMVSIRIVPQKLWSTNTNRPRPACDRSHHGKARHHSCAWLSSLL